MRLPVAALCVTVLLLGCEDRPRSLLDVAKKKPVAPPQEAEDPMLEDQLADLPEPRRSPLWHHAETSAPPQPRPVLPPGVTPGLTLRYDFSVEPEPGKPSANFTVEARYRVMAIIGEVVVLDVALVPGAGAHPDLHAFSGTLRLHGLAQDDLGINLSAIPCPDESDRCTLKGKLAGAPTVVVSPSRPELALTSHIVQYDQRFTSNVHRRISLRSAESGVRGVPEPVDASRAHDTSMPPLTWTWRYLAERLPARERPDREENEVAGPATDTQRMFTLEARAAAMGVCRSRFPLNDDRPWAPFVLRVAWGKLDHVSDISMRPNTDVKENHPWVRCVKGQLQTFLDAEPRARLPQGEFVDVTIPVPR